VNLLYRACAKKYSLFMRSHILRAARLWAAAGLLACALLAETPAANASRTVKQPVDFTFVKGDSRQGERVQVHIAGDSLRYLVTTYNPSEPPVQTERTVRLSVHRQISLLNVLGNLPRYPAFGSCFGKGMRYYLVETSEGKFYRSLPERAGRCYSDEPGIWSMFQDLDDLAVPPAEPDYQDYTSAS
jgi:hypothetical protein